MRAICERQLLTAVARSRAPGAAACVGSADEILYLGATGFRQREPQPLPAEDDTLYDLASLTKVVATTTAAMMLMEQGKLSLEDRVSDHIPEPAFRSFQIKHLLTHTTGLPAFKAFYKDVASTDQMIAKIAELQPSWTPGSRRRYSDFGFILLGKIISLAGRDTLDAFCQKNIFDPLQMTDTGYRPDKTKWSRVAATENCAWRGRIMRGEVHDENAFAMGGVSGHAGLFGTAADLAKFCQAMLNDRLLKASTMESMLRAGRLERYPWQGLGWNLDGWMRSSSGYLPSRSAFGHTGWTGTNLWMDYESKRFSILLSNTCHTSRRSRNNRTLRQTFYIPMSREWYPASTNAHTGLDALMYDDFDPLRGKRIALLTNHAAVDQTGRHIIDTLKLEPEVMLKRLYSPEHGIRGHAEAGESVPSENGPVPITSLYGDRKAPSAEELSAIETFVVDLPDIGARYYTYMATMKACLEACDKAKVPVVILDRPNPIGGGIVEGPLPDRIGSVVCCADIPVRHGLTLGELALFFHKRYLGTRGTGPQIIRTDNWPRELQHPQTALPWVAPSPNMPDHTTALLYIGQCLFEGVNLNEGRGTPVPFQLCGAPWLDAQAVIDRVPAEYRTGVTLGTAEYVPIPIAGKVSNPTYNGERCNGIRIQLNDAESARPFMLSVALLIAIRDVHGDTMTFRDFFDTLAGGPWLREQILSGARPSAIEARCRLDAGKFAQQRTLLYETSPSLIAAYS